MVRTHHIEHRRLRLHHIRTDSSGICNGIVNARTVAHMLPQKLHADIHQFHRIQRASPLFRRTGRMGSLTRKLILYLNTGIGRPCHDLVAVMRMPGKRRVQILPDTIPRHERLGCAALFSGASVKNHSSGTLCLLQECLHTDCRCHGSRAQKVVPAAMTVPACNKLLLLQTAAFLGQTGKSIILCQNSDNRSTAAEACAEGCLNTCNAFLYLKALLLQSLAIESSRLVFLQRKLGIFPYFIRCARN